MAINSNLENDLRLYSETMNSDLFNDKLYQPLCQLASSIISKRGIRKNIEELIQEMVAEVSILLPRDYNKTKAHAKSFVYIIMDQYLIHLSIFNSKQKRDWRKVIYIEDMEVNGPDDRIHLVKVEYDELTMMKETLFAKRHLFKQLKHKLHRKVAETIIDAIENPQNYKEEMNSIIKDIGKKTKCSKSIIYNVIKQMKALLALST